MDSRVIDITGLKVGNNGIVKQHIGVKGGKRKGTWLCVCDCGQDFTADSKRIRKGEIKSCPSCSYKKMYAERRNKWLGFVFGNNCKVTKIFETSGKYFNMEILCNCGRKFITKNVRVGNKLKPISCCVKCSRLHQSNMLKNSIVNKVYGNLRIIQRLEKDQSHNYFVLCQCDCGALVKKRLPQLTVGDGLSCGCTFWEPNNQERYTPEYFKFIRFIYKRDKYTCVLTGQRGKVRAHHIASYANNPLLRYDPNNVVTLHKDVHDLFHNKHGYGMNTKEQFEEFKQFLII